ncbi:Hypothetical predicted protein [Mytilus galloprovincialis]|uniref:B box-type domain-containing protein n=1 Tax=Mytilus galloprovincialis TaxID=29158 RepID=A0A8B6CLR1_MYTGA|nr:Hypothetical predicted protein [Mytilus galloprovincialis]
MADMHHVVEIKYAGSKDKDTFQKANRVKCKIHILQDYCIFCQTCDELVCPSCLTKSYQRHDLQEINEVFSEDIKSLRGCQAELNNKFLDVYEKQILTIETTKLNNTDHLKMVKGKLEKQESKFISALTSFKQTILEDLEKKTCEIESVASTTKPTILQNIDEIRDKLDVTANVVNTKDIENVHKTANNLRKWLSFTPEPVSIHPTVFKTLPDFFPEPIDENTVGKLFGHLSDKNGIPISLVETITSNMPSIDRLIVNNKNEIWISDATLIFTTSANTNDLDEHNLYVVTENEIKILCSFKPNIPRAVYVSKIGLTYISTRDSGSIYEKKESSIRQIVTLDKDGKQDKVFECTGTSDFCTNIKRIRDRLDCLYVIDAYKPYLEGRIMSLGKNKALKWIYDGGLATNKHSFVPSDLEVTSVGKIVVCDMFNHALRILGKDGYIIHHILLEELGIYLPCCLDIIQNDKIYIGCRQEKTEVTKNGKIYLVSLSEF